MTIEEPMNWRMQLPIKIGMESKKNWATYCSTLLFLFKNSKRKKRFTLEEVINAIAEKLIIRHPHIYGNVQVSDERRCEEKLGESKVKGGKKIRIKRSTTSLPATVKAMRLQEKARQWVLNGKIKSRSGKK